MGSIGVTETTVRVENDVEKNIKRKRKGKRKIRSSR